MRKKTAEIIRDNSGVMYYIKDVALGGEELPYSFLTRREAIRFLRTDLSGGEGGFTHYVEIGGRERPLKRKG